MESLVTLDLSHNNLSGSIPSSFEEMHGLSYIDISYNYLEGPLPNITIFREASPKRLKGNKGLCSKVGPMLPPCNAHGSKKDHKCKERRSIKILNKTTCMEKFPFRF
ncbi:MDIS1-interacting receptor like kinase 2 isoform X1 [Prunus yedoensis var. nudiflora]|uniref:MDIS1-interacting receptor like kinase 2 isoform X1 n=1 Tax=Prunus yedoensis var. nudiflora TaxID=2094558 RepID=A0A314V4M0_PRUYE|nr:MDIS1-interacting receptor like kinase 2 isoform X1 [Prunus yedoensis var. nudiflora]